MSSEEMSSSAVSGTTLARALIGNSFALSSDNRSRYRSGTSVLTRQDSATLPNSDFYMFNSPYGRDSPNDVPLPSNAESVYSPPKIVRNGPGSPDTPDSAHPYSAKKRLSTGSIRLDTEIPDGENSGLSVKRSNSTSRVKLSASTTGTRVPDIPEVPTPHSATTFGPQVDELTGRPSREGDSTPDLLNGYPSPPPVPITPERERELPPTPRTPSSPAAASLLSPPVTSPLPSEPPSSARSFGEVLDNYYLDDDQDSPALPMQTELLSPPQGQAPLPHPEINGSYRPMLSPLKEETASQLSPGSQRSLISPPLRTADSMMSISSPLAQSMVSRTASDSTDSLPSAKDLGPRPPPTPPRTIVGGERTRLSQTISLPRQKGDTRAASASLSTNDASDSLHPPALNSLINRGRSGSTPAPIQVARDSKDSHTYNITVSQGSSELGIRTPTTGESDPGRQTFPETPSVFSPSWSMAPTSAAVTTDGQRDSSVSAAPTSPQSASLPSLASGFIIAPHTLARSQTAVVRGARPPSSSGLSGLPLQAPPRQKSPSLHEVPEEEEQSGQQPEAGPSTIRAPDFRDSVSVYSNASQEESRDASHDEHSDDRDSGSQSFERTTPTAGHNASPQRARTIHNIMPVTTPLSPPPYYTAVNDPIIVTGIPTPSTGGSGGDGEIRYGFSPVPTPSTASVTASASTSARRRARPPGPLGPRRPSQGHGLTPGTGTPLGHRQRQGSVSSTTSTTHGRRRSFISHQPSLRFQTPPVRWRGYTYDQARWTFTSAQLQTIVSRAIRQSADGTKIRLLPLEALDNDVPNELRQLELRRTDIQTRFKILTQNRSNMFSALTHELSEGVAPQEADASLRLVDELKEVSMNLDQLTEELHVVDEQIAQLQSLQDVHSASALAMALRKLNTSFLRQVDDIKVLRDQVESLEAERDDAWRYAESEAVKYDTMIQQHQQAAAAAAATSSEASSNRSSRMSAARKSSIRASKSGLRSSYAASRRSSVSSNNRLSISVLSSGAKSSFEDIPPVPRIPRRPFVIHTDMQTRSSMALSSAGYTPTSETRAMVQAQDELYELLGLRPGHRRAISVRGSNTVEMPIPKRRRSSLDGSGEVPARPSSLPGPAELMKESSLRDDERAVMIHTLEMLSNEE
ncbi:hypothetical protein DL96DRAFT_1033474 [Flagelloscypha sp. PMI_526]|nr:hypothetical protein DL96DRAFT_1033474 [Flagelloscypha sp. PMI_526]